MGRGPCEGPAPVRDHRRNMIRSMNIVYGALPCANCGATVDSRDPACWNCGQKFG